MNSVLVIILSFLFFVLPYKTCKSSNLQIGEVPFADRDDPGTPLYLTPLIESGRIEEAQTKAIVRYHEMGDVKSYSGYLTVNKEYKSNLFFWFFPAVIISNTAPVVLWLQHKPGLTSMYGLFMEHGPFTIVNKTLEMRQYSLNLYHNVIYIDSPVGTGYSFTKDLGERGYCRNSTQVARDLYTALVQFFLLFPDLQNNDFFVTGESYGGKYVVAVAHEIKKNNIRAKTKINLKGLAIGNGLCDPPNQLLYSDYLYRIGLIDLNEKAEFQKHEQTIREFIKQKNFVKAYENFEKLFVDNSSLFRNLTGLMQHYNFVHANNHYNDYLHYNLLIDSWIRNYKVRQAVHVGGNYFSFYELEVFKYQKEDYFNSVVVLLIDLLKHYRVLIYNGQLNTFNAYPLAENYLQKMRWSGREKFAKAPREFWKVERDLAGFAKSADNLMFVLVRNAGNLVFIDQPKWAIDLIKRFTHNIGFK